MPQIVGYYFAQQKKSSQEKREKRQNSCRRRDKSKLPDKTIITSIEKLENHQKADQNKNHSAKNNTVALETNNK